MTEAEYREQLNRLEEQLTAVYRERRRLQEAFADEHPAVLPPARYRTAKQDAISPTNGNGTAHQVDAVPRKASIAATRSTLYITFRPKGNTPGGGGLAVRHMIPASVASATRGGVACERRGYVTTTNGGGGTGMVALTRSQTRHGGNDG